MMIADDDFNNNRLIERFPLPSGSKIYKSSRWRGVDRIDIVRSSAAAFSNQTADFDLPPGDGRRRVDECRSRFLNRYIVDNVFCAAPNRRRRCGVIQTDLLFFSMYLPHRRDNYVAGNTYNTPAAA